MFSPYRLMYLLANLLTSFSTSFLADCCMYQPLKVILFNDSNNRITSLMSSRFCTWYRTDTDTVHLITESVSHPCVFVPPQFGQGPVRIISAKALASSWISLISFIPFNC